MKIEDVRGRGDVLKFLRFSDPSVAGVAKSFFCAKVGNWIVPFDKKGRPMGMEPFNRAGLVRLAARLQERRPKMEKLKERVVSDAEALIKVVSDLGEGDAGAYALLALDEMGSLESHAMALSAVKNLAASVASLEKFRKEAT